ncbi:MAG: hypothetical protein AB7K71_38980 [Polyangiaceae bacterium]
MFERAQPKARNHNRVIPQLDPRGDGRADAFDAKAESPRVPAASAADLPRTRRSRKPAWIVAGACGGLALLFIAYGIGRYDAGLERQRVEQAAEAQAAGQARQTQALKSELGAERSHALQLKAIASLYQATLSLGKKNFGLAETQLKAAADQLEQSAPDTGSEQDALIIALRDTKVVVTDDVSDQRRQLDELGRRLLATLADPR